MIFVSTQCFPPRAGGIENYMAGVCKALVNGGFVVQAFADGGADARDFDREKPEPYQIHRYGGVRPIRRLFKARDIKKRIASGEVEAVICDSWKSAEPIVPLEVPVICLAHGAEYSIRQGQSRRARRIKRVLSSVNLVLAVSEFTRDLVISNGVPSAKIQTFSPPIDEPSNVDQAATQRLSERLNSKGGPTIVSLCRLEPRKGIDQVMEAVSKLSDKFPNLSYLVGGAGDDLGRLETLTRRFGIEERVYFLGRVSADEKAALFTLADLFVMPNRKEGSSVEGYGIVFIEAGWFGVPAIAGRDGGAGDAVEDGRSGLLCDGTSIASVCSAMEELLSNGEQRLQMGEAARKKALQHTWFTRGPILSDLVKGAIEN